MADIHWQCQLNHLEEADQPGIALAQEVLTVGEKFYLSCEGPEVQVDAASLNLELPKEQQYDLKLLKNLGVDSHKASFVATSYTVNDKGHQFQNIFLSDGKVRIALDGISFAVKSVITAENNPKHEPYPPAGPFNISYPFWFWACFVLLFLFFSSLGVEKIIDRIRRKKFFKLLDSHRPAISAYHQLTKELRQLGRDSLRPQNFNANPESAHKFLNDLNSSFRWYLSRSLEFSCFESRAGQILSKLKQKDAELYQKIHHSLARVLIEIERCQKKHTQLKIDDAVQLIEMVRLAADEINKTVHTKAENKVSRNKLEAEV